MLFNCIKRGVISVDEICDRLEIVRSTFYRKAKDPHNNFNVNQAVKLQRILNMSQEEFEAIFF